jgi:hypothetical protein
MSHAADIKVKAVPVVLDRTRSFLFDLNAFVELEEKTGSIDSALGGLGERNVKMIRTLVWAALIHEDEKLTEKQVGSWLDFSIMENIIEKLYEALKAALPERIVKDIETPEDILEREFGSQDPQILGTGDGTITPGP